MKQQENNYIDVTSEWIKSATPNSHRIIKAKYFESDNGTRYYVDDKYVKLNCSKKEIEVAKWIKETFGGKIYLLPEVNKPENIRVSDYLWNNEKWDLKEVLGNSLRNIDNKIKSAYKQSNNFIIDNSKNILSNDEIVRQIEKIYSDSQRNWVDKIILINNNKLIKVFKRK